MSNDDEDSVRFNVQMPRTLRDDAKENSERGELSEDVRDLFRRKAYGETGDSPTEYEQTKQELRQVRTNLDRLRLDRDQLDSKIRSVEARAARLEERLSELDQERDQLSQSLSVLENMLHDGGRMWPTRIKNAVDVDRATAEELYQTLQEENAELPDAAFTEPGVHDPTDWRDE